MGPNPLDWCPYMKRLRHRFTEGASHEDSLENMTIYKPRREASEETTSAKAKITDFWPSELWAKIFVV